MRVSTLMTGILVVLSLSATGSAAQEALAQKYRHCINEIKRTCPRANCVILHFVEGKSGCTDDCMKTAGDAIRRLGIPVHISGNIGQGHPASCVGPRRDITGTLLGAECLKNMLVELTGKPYPLVDNSTCRRSGWPYNVHLH